MGAEQSKLGEQQGMQKTGLIKQMMNGFSGKNNLHHYQYQELLIYNIF